MCALQRMSGPGLLISEQPCERRAMSTSSLAGQPLARKRLYQNGIFNPSLSYRRTPHHHERTPRWTDTSMTLAMENLLLSCPSQFPIRDKSSLLIRGVAQYLLPVRSVQTELRGEKAAEGIRKAT
jgi:hypothetical protein